MMKVHGCKGWQTACTTYIHITLGLNPLHSSSYPNMASMWSTHHLWSGSPGGDPLMWIWVWRRVRAEPPPPLQVLFARPCLPPLEMARRGEIPQIRRRPGKPDCKLLTWAAPQKASLSRADRLRGCAQRPDCLRLPVNKRQSQQARLQWHVTPVTLFLCTNPSTFTLHLIIFLKDFCSFSIF